MSESDEIGRYCSDDVQQDVMSNNRDLSLIWEHIVGVPQMASITSQNLRRVTGDGEAKREKTFKGEAEEIPNGKEYR